MTKTDDTEYLVTREDDASRYTLTRGGELLSVLDFRDDGRTIALTRAFTIPTFRGSGHAARVVAGAVAILVTLATSGVADAVVVAAVALVVQQLDNDVLAPVIYGRSLQLHPLAVLFALVGGGALFGFAGTVLAVPITAIAVNMVAEARAMREEDLAALPAAAPPSPP